MKNLKPILFGIMIILFSLTSCTDDTGVNLPESSTQTSATLKVALNELRTQYVNSSQMDTIPPAGNDTIPPVGNDSINFCFDFVYPITLSYNDETEVVVQSFNQLIEILTSMTDELYIDGIAFPFQVEIEEVNGEIEIQTINNEAEFIELLISCSFDDGNCEDDCPTEYDPVCVETPNGGVIEFHNYCIAECEGFTQQDIVDCNPSGNECEDDCPTEYDPVCVETPNGEIIEFHNYCIAECEGFTQQDLVDCNPSGNECEDDCPTEYDPVCVETPNGEIIEFHNYCIAECKGFTQQDMVDCQ